MTSITFLLPTPPIHPSGGYKVVYEYANRLSKDGFNVKIAYAGTILFNERNFIGKCKSLIKLLYYKIKGTSIYNNWMTLEDNIEEYLALSLNKRHLKESDYYIATAIETSKYLNEFDISERNKIYFIQDYENWFQSDAEVLKSYSFLMKKIVISNWLLKIVSRYDNKCVLIPNGFDFNKFSLINPIKTRNKFCIAMLYHSHERKGCKYGLKAIIKLKEIYPNLNAKLFGVPKRPQNLPSWIEYYQTPDNITHNKIYNSAAVYIAPSIVEGWGLTVGEAMICGAAIVCTEIDGFKEMIVNNINGLMVPIKDDEAIVSKVKYLIDNDQQRYTLAEEANKSIQKFKWDNSYNLFKETILK